MKQCFSLSQIESMKLAMIVKLKDQGFVVKQIVDLMFLTDDQHHQVQINSCDITGNVTTDWPPL